MWIGLNGYDFIKWNKCVLCFKNLFWNEKKRKKTSFKGIWRELCINAPSLSVKDTAMSSHTVHKSCKVITVPFVQTVTSWSSTECPTACSPPVPVNSTRKWNQWHRTYRKLNTQRLSPMAKRGWTVSVTKKNQNKKNTRLTSFLCFSKSLIFFSYTSTSQGLVGVFSAAFPLCGNITYC